MKENIQHFQNVQNMKNLIIDVFTIYFKRKIGDELDYIESAGGVKMNVFFRFIFKLGEDLFYQYTKTDLKCGLKSDGIQARRQIFGTNEKKLYTHGCNKILKNN
jgi:hypothetical protein